VIRSEIIRVCRPIFSGSCIHQQYSMKLWKDCLACRRASSSRAASALDTLAEADSTISAAPQSKNRILPKGCFIPSIPQ
jgi:hypothetical protein